MIRFAPPPRIRAARPPRLRTNERVASALDQVARLLEAWNGRLAEVPGIGPRRLEGLRAVLDRRLTRSGSRGALRDRLRLGGADARRPSVDTLLSVYAEYRAGAEGGMLRRIAPRRLNPHGVAWLPILHTERGPWNFQALVSDTALAHRLGKTRDWVVLYWERDGRDGQATVVTESRGPLSGCRVVRGRDAECSRYHGVSLDGGDGQPARP